MKLILFDSSGTVIDDSETAYHAFKAHFNLYGRDLSFTSFRENFCLPISAFLAKMGMPADALRTFPAIISQTYINSLIYARLLPDVEECLVGLRQKGIRMGIVSATPAQLLWASLRRFGIDGYFEVVLSDASKPSPQPIFQACEKMGIHPDERVVYVGDMEEDMLCAKQAGVTAVGVCRDGSYHDRARLGSQNPKYLISDLRQLPDLLTPSLRW